MSHARHLGMGIGLRPCHFPHILEHHPDIDWFEILTENYLATGGRPQHVLLQVAERYPIVMHGVSMSLGGSAPLDFDYLAMVKELAARVNAVMVSDHVCWTGHAGRNIHDLMPMPYNDEALAHMARRIRAVQDFLERPILVENPSSYAEFTSTTVTEWDFMRELCREADCGMLLDVNNVYVSARNHGFDPLAYIDALDAERIGQYHVAGHSPRDGYLLDSHKGPIIDPVWDVYRHALKRIGPRSTLIEWDTDIPAFEVVHAEAEKARRIEREMSQPSSRAARSPEREVSL